MTDEKSFIRRIPGFRSGTWWKMGLAVLGYGFIILLIIGMLVPDAQTDSGSSPSSSQPMTTNAIQSTITHTTTTAVPTQTSVATAAPSLKITGMGDDVVAFSASGSALRVFSMQHSGSSNFAIWLKDEQGNNKALLVNEIGSYSGKKSERLSSGKYYLDVTASGPWTVEISPSVTQTQTTTGRAPLVLRGSGDDVVGFSSTGTALRIFSMQHSGSSNFAIWLKDEQGNNKALLVNEIGSYSGKKSEKLTSGNYYLDVTASGPWTVEIAS